MVPWESLMSRVGYVTMQVADAFSSHAVGDQIPRAQDFATQFDCGNGTIQAAFGMLEQAGALTLTSRGRLGTFITHIDHSLLWELAGRRSISVAMPLPYSRRYEALATGLQSGFTVHDLPLSLMFVRGSLARVRALREGRADLALMSALAASSEDNLEVIHDFGPTTYVEAHCLLLRHGTDQHDPTLRVGVDHESRDQVHLVRTLFAALPDTQFIPVSYSQLDHSFRDGTIDATIWNLDEVHRHIDSPVTITAIPTVSHELNTHAVITRIRSDNPLPLGVQQAINDPSVLDSYQSVLSGRMNPTY